MSVTPTDHSNGLPAERLENGATTSSHFAWLRTRFSVERTLMSSQRTAVSLIGFGFAIVQFFNYLEKTPQFNSALLPDAPYYLGLGLIFCGILLLAVSIFQYHRVLSHLWSGRFAALAGVTKEGMKSPTTAVSLAILLVGIFAFLAVLLRSA